jgi:hypothetical protein
MTTRFAILKYVADLRRNEPVNVGVAVWGEAGTALRLRGQAGDRIDGRSARLPKADLANYRAWFEYWTYLLDTPGPVRDVPPRRRGDNFFAEPGGELLFGADTDATALADDLYRQLVEGGPPDLEAHNEDTFRDVVEDLLREADLLGRPQMHRDYTVRGTTGQEWPFPYAWVNGHVTLGYVLPAIKRNLADSALWRLTNVPDTMNKVLFVPAIEDHDEATVAQLEQAAHVAEVGSATPADIHSMFVAA